MRIHRRQFLKYCIGSAAAFGLPMTVLGRLEQALAAEGTTLPKVIWLNGANCTGCTVSLANLFSESGPTDIADLLVNTIDLEFHPNLMGAAGDAAVQQLKDTAGGSFILVVDGGIPTAFNGHTCMLWTDQGHEVTALEAVQMLAPKAAAVLAVGTCASYGGIPAGNPNPTGIVSVSEISGASPINIPGCPTHPDSIVWTIAHLLAGEMPQLDAFNRPLALFETSVHRNCPRRGLEYATTFGIEDLCLRGIGCKGPSTKSECPSRKWNNGTNWCIGAGALCIGCTEQTFPDGVSPFYSLPYQYALYEKPEPPVDDPDETEPDPGDLSLKIDKATWSARRELLSVEGKGKAGMIVTIFDAASGVQLGATSVDKSRRWKFQQRKPVQVPSRLRAESGGQTAFVDVTHGAERGRSSHRE